MIRDWMILIGFSVAVAITANFFHPNKIPFFGHWDGQLVPVTENPTEQMTAKTARMLWEEGALFLDARPGILYEKGHILNAVSFPVARFDLLVGDLAEVLFSAKTIVVYCSGVDCSDSHRLGGLLLEMGDLPVRIYEKGYPDWVAKGFPVAKGAQ